MQISFGQIAFGRLVIAIFITLFCTATAFSDTLRIPRDYATIQEGIEAAQEGDIVLVDRGTYVENLDFKGKSISVKSVEGHKFTTIDGNRKGSVVRFSGKETKRSVLEGFTLTNGSGTLVADEDGLNFCGGGIYCHFKASPTIRNNFILGNGVKGFGGAVYCHLEAAPRLANNTIKSNKARLGGGVFCHADSAPLLKENSIYKNKAETGGAVYCVETAKAVIRNNFIGSNSAGEGYDEIEGNTDTSTILENTYE